MSVLFRMNYLLAVLAAFAAFMVSLDFFHGAGLLGFAIGVIVGGWIAIAVFWVVFAATPFVALTAALVAAAYWIG